MSLNQKQNDFLLSLCNHPISPWNDSALLPKKFNFMASPNICSKPPAGFKRKNKNLKKYMELVGAKEIGVREIGGKEDRGGETRRTAFKQIYLSNFQNLKQEMSYLQTNFKKILLTKRQPKSLQHKYFSSLLSNSSSNKNKHARTISQSINFRPLTSEMGSEEVYRSVRSECLSRKMKKLGRVGVGELSFKKEGGEGKRLGMLNITINQFQSRRIREVLKSLQRVK